MSSILVVDDHATNRELIVTLIEHGGNRPLEAADGAEALALVRSERPDLVISDILMPTMDGFEFVRRLRADPELGATRVIFYTAHYHEREARSLAATCGVSRVLMKPCEPALILQAIDEVLAGKPLAPRAPPEAGFDREHLRLMTDKLSEKVAELSAANQRLAALNDVNLQLASEHDPQVLLRGVCRDARELVGAKFALLAVRDKTNGQGVFFTTSGLDAATANGLQRPPMDAGILAEILSDRRARRFVNAAGSATLLPLPRGFPPVESALVAPVASLTVAYGWICLLNKLGAEGFSAEDERILTSLASQVGRIYENGSLYAALRHHAEQLRESEQRFRQLAENIHEVFFLVKADGSQVLYISPPYEEVWGRTVESLYANPKSWMQAIHPDDLATVRDGQGKGIAGENFDYDYRIVRPDGAIRWINDRGFPIRDDAGQVYRFAGIAEDITVRVGLERELRESEAGLHRAQLMAKLAHVITAADGSFESWSETLPALAGVSPGSVPRSTRAWLEIVHGDDREEFRRTAIEAGTAATRAMVEYRLNQADGQCIHVRQVMEPLEARLRASGRTRWFSTLQDVTEEKRAREEVLLLNADLERRVTERTAALETVNRELEAYDYTLFHDIRAPLNRIQGFTKILLEEQAAKLDPSGREMLERLATAGDRMDQLVTDLLELSTVARGEVQRVSVDMSALARSVGDALSAGDPGRDVELVVMPGLHERADSRLVRVVLENLMGNAWKFTSKTPGARIEVGSKEHDGKAVFFVSDNGAGFDASQAGKLFTPFKRLHSDAEFKGTGVGLATVQRVVRRHGGRAWAEGEIGRGAAFYFTLSS